jgi:uncharacterized protein DUF3300
MKRIQSGMSFLMSFLLLSATTSMEGCGAKEPAAASAAQQQPASTSAENPPSQQPPTGSDQSAQGDQANQTMELPEVNFTADGLDELLAPIALYPDPVLAVLLQSAVNPQEVMDGGNWLALDENQNLKEAALDQASSKAGFTPVMQALLHYPTVVDLMCQQFDWTKQVGAAYQGNPKAVLESVQRLRAQAVDTGALKSSPQMKVDVKQDQGREVVELTPGDSKVVYIPQYDPSRVYSTTTTTTTPGGTTTTTTTSSAPASSGSSTVVVQQQQSGVSTESAVLIGLLSFGAGIAVGMAINRNNYYYPAWGYGGVWYGPRPYYPPYYRPVYHPGWGGGYYYHRPPYYSHTNVYVNVNKNYYNRFNNNGNLNPNYKPRPVPYNTNKNSTYARSMGNSPGGNKGANYRPATTPNTGKGQGNYQGNRSPNNANANARPTTGNVQNRPGGGQTGNNGNNVQRPSTGNVGSGANNNQRPSAGNNANNWKGQPTYQGANKGAGAGNNAPARPSTLPGNTNAGSSNRASTGNAPARNPSGDRGFSQTGGARPTTGTGYTPTTRPSTGNTSASRPAPTTQPSSRPAPQQNNRSQSSSNGGAFAGVSNPKSDQAASNRGRASAGGAQRSSGGAGQKKK